ncbi:hypothetical protein VTN31DRAFT_3665 [Thermomyces dupontii]|uniref:uncharacterized protein n=1 Tax=Talaromyces thermophilus TaxID=28565 RepID=UPI0037432AB6
MQAGPSGSISGFCRMIKVSPVHDVGGLLDMCLRLLLFLLLCLLLLCLLLLCLLLLCLLLCLLLFLLLCLLLCLLFLLLLRSPAPSTVLSERRNARVNRVRPWAEDGPTWTRETNGNQPARSVRFPPVFRPPFHPRVGDKVAPSAIPSCVVPPKSILANLADEVKEKSTKRVQFSDIVRIQHVRCWIYPNKHVFSERASRSG